MHRIELITTITGGLLAALVLGYITHRLRLSPIVGYLLAGIAVGPHTPGFVADQGMAVQLAEIGVILLMFGVGLHFQPKDLFAVQGVAVPGAVFQSATATALTALVTHGFGWSLTAGLIMGLALSVASTVVLVRVLTDYRDLHTPSGHVAVGWLVVEDLFTVIVLVLMPALLGTSSPTVAGIAQALLVTTLKILALLLFVIVVGSRVIPWLFEKASETQSRELFILTVLGAALGVAVGASEVFGVSMALGAFLAGMVVARSEFGLRAASEALPMRDAFSVLFFVSVGMLLDPVQLVESASLVIATLAIVLVGKPLAAFSIVLFLRYPLKVALAVSVALAQIGEFSFILATLGRGLGALPDSAMNILVATAIVSITLNPLLYRLVDPLESWLMRRAPLRRWLQARTAGVAPASPRPARPETGHRAVIVGYGPVGRTISRLLRENEIDTVIVELNLDTVRQLRAEGHIAIYGDASHPDTLELAGVSSAGSLILSASGLNNSTEIIRLARGMNPDIRILARTSYVREMEPLRRAGALSYSGEGEVALTMLAHILRRLGASPEQIERERARVHAELSLRPADASPPPPGGPSSDPEEATP